MKPTRLLSSGLAYLTCFALLGACGDDVVDPMADAAPAAVDASTAVDADNPAIDAAVDVDAAVPLGDPIEAPNETWTWIGFADAYCADGSTTGIGVNLTDRSDNAFIYMQGGGACWDYLTCYVLQTAINITGGYGEADFQADLGGLGGAMLFDRNDPNNPLRDWSYIFIPYCTGDVHSGNNTANYQGQETMHVGYNNTSAYLSRIVPTFPNADRIVISGSSAGGFGAAFNWGRTQDLFAPTRVDLLDDSGPPLPSPYLSEALEQSWRTSWGVDSILPAECAACADELYAVLPYDFARYPDSRKALLSYTRDNVIASYYQIAQAEVEQGLGALATAAFEPDGNAEVFYVTGTSHTMLGNPAGTSQNGVVLLDWLVQMLNDDPGWTSVTP